MRQNLLAKVNAFLTMLTFRSSSDVEALQYLDQFRFEINFGVGIVDDKGAENPEPQDRAKVVAMMDVGSLIGLKRSGVVAVEAVPLVFSMSNLAAIAKQTARLRSDLRTLSDVWDADATSGFLVLQKDIRKTLRQQTPWENLSGEMQEAVGSTGRNYISIFPLLRPMILSNNGSWILISPKSQAGKKALWPIS